MLFLLYSLGKKIMNCPPGPKLFRKRRIRYERPNSALARFASIVSTFFSSLYVYKASTPSLPPRKRKNILKRMRKACSNRVSIMSTISEQRK